MSRTSHYVHGSDDLEQRRLTTLNAFINQRMLPEIRVRKGERIIDFGAGLGQFTRLLAASAGAARPAVAIERDPRQIAEARRQAREAGEDHLVEFRHGDVLDPPLQENEWGTFDVAHARFILEHVPDALGVVKNMLRSMRSGGRIILADDDHDVIRLWPEPPGFDAVWRAYMQTYSSAGNDPIIGRRLVELLHAAGAKPIRNSWVFFGACAGEAVWPLIVENCASILEGAREAILRQPGMSEGLMNEAASALRQWKQRPDSAFWYAIAYAEGAKP